MIYNILAVGDVVGACGVKQDAVWAVVFAKP